MPDERLRQLLLQYFEKKITPAEEDELMARLRQDSSQAEVQSVMEEVWNTFSMKATVFDPAHSEAMLQSIMQQQPQVASSTQKSVLSKMVWMKRIAAAAIIIILCSAAGFYIWNRYGSKNKMQADQPRQSLFRDVAAPLTSHAVLTLAGGRNIVLDSLKTGSLAIEGNTDVQKLANGQLQYSGDLHPKSGALLYNTLANPRGSGVIALQLTDGSRIWLNAESTLRYPVVFADNERKVEITGEGYFEVAKNAAMPFVVIAGEARVQVLGTHFNVHAYKDEREIRTTLLEGSIKISGSPVAEANIPLILKPGQQAMLGEDSRVVLVEHANTETAIAWKNGYFQFDGVDMRTLMRQIGRWYDLDIEYSGPVQEHEFVGKIPMDRSLTGILNILQQSEVHFRLEGKKLIVTP